MRRLILIRHSAPTLEPGVPPEKWRLSDEGRRRATVLAAEVAELNPASLFSSDEPKSVETAEYIADSTGLTLKVEPGFKEHVRPASTPMPHNQWLTLVADAIQRPDEHVLGLETTGAARDRFTATMETATKSVEGDIAIVSHGTVMSLFVAQLTGLDAVEVWREFGLPGFVVVGWPESGGIKLRRNYGDG